jgi:hypothetical protein
MIKVHVCSKVKCVCGCKYCTRCYASKGCPQCEKGKPILKTKTTTEYSNE